METADKAGDGGADKGAALTKKLAALKERQARHQARLATLKEGGETQCAEVDKDARLLTKNAQGVAGYNVQLAVDAKHKLLIHCEVTGDGNDTGQLAPMAQAAKATLGVEMLDVTADTGYYNQIHLKACLDNGITPYAPAPRHPSDQRRIRAACRAADSSSKRIRIVTVALRDSPCCLIAASRSRTRSSCTIGAIAGFARVARCASGVCRKRRRTGKSTAGSMRRSPRRMIGAWRKQARPI